MDIVYSKICKDKKLQYYRNRYLCPSKLWDHYVLFELYVSTKGCVLQNYENIMSFLNYMYQQKVEL